MNLIKDINDSTRPLLSSPFPSSQNLLTNYKSIANNEVPSQTKKAFPGKDLLQKTKTALKGGPRYNERSFSHPTHADILAHLPRNVPRKVIGEMRRKKSISLQKQISKRRLAIHAFSYEIDIERLKGYMNKRTNENTPSSTVESYPFVDLESGDGNHLSQYALDWTSWDCNTYFDVLHLSKTKPIHYPDNIAGVDEKHVDLENIIDSNNKKNNGASSDAGVVTGIAKPPAEAIRPSYSLEFSALHSLGSIVYDEDYRETASEVAIDMERMKSQVSDADGYIDAEEPKGPVLAAETVDVFLFPFGSVVFWNFEDEADEVTFMYSLQPYMERLFDNPDLKQSANDKLEFLYSIKFNVKHDVVKLATRDPREKFAVSYAFAQSNLLSVYEWRLDKIISKNEHIPQELVETGKMSISQESISRQVGKLFMERNSINLQSDILDTPPFFWENDEWDPVYKMVCKYLEHESRIDVLNRRLDCVHELLSVLQAQATNQHNNTLEWIVIWLVASEVIIQVIWNIIVKDIFGLFPRGGDD